MRVTRPATTVRFLQLAALLLIASACAAPAPWYFGTYKIVRAERAPWLAPDQAPDANEIASYVDKPVTIGASIAGPGLLACAKPTYVLKKVEAAYLFEGGLATGDQPEATADAAATKLGFKKGDIEALETGCESEITYQFRDHNTAAFALDNVIYWLERR